MEGSGARFVSPTGYVELDNDCQYSIDNKSTRSREYINPKEDLAFYFQNYLVPKYGLDNINVSNVATFMKELEMNWSKLTPELKDNVLDIMVDNILVSDNYDFKNKLVAKLNIPPSTQSASNPTFSKSTFGKNDFTHIMIGLIVLGLLIFLITYYKPKISGFPKMI
jgi:hypothetical protein